MTAETLEERLTRLIRMADERKEFITLEDGFIYYWPDRTASGCISAYELRALADELDKRNADWQRIIDQFFDESVLAQKEGLNR